MKYDLNGKTINIPDAVLNKIMATLDVPMDEAIEVYLSDEGLIDNETVEEMTARAKAAGTGAKATGERKERKPPTRKPDEDKRALIARLAEIIEDGGLCEHDGFEVINIERMIAFTFKGEKYELTLTKKRKPK